MQQRDKFICTSDRIIQCSYNYINSEAKLDRAAPWASDYFAPLAVFLRIIKYELLENVYVYIVVSHF